MPHIRGIRQSEAKRRRFPKAQKNAALPCGVFGLLIEFSDVAFDLFCVVIFDAGALIIFVALAIAVAVTVAITFVTVSAAAATTALFEEIVYSSCNTCNCCDNTQNGSQSLQCLFH